MARQLTKAPAKAGALAFSAAPESKLPGYSSNQSREVIATLFRHMALLAGNRSGAAAIDYALIAGLVSVAVIAGAQSVGINLKPLYEAAASAIP